MEVISVNRGDAQLVEWRGKKVRTGIYKYPVDEAIFLGHEDVVDDAVVDRKHHGGLDKAVYAYSVNHYPFWKEQFPNAEWSLGMFGENLTVKGLDESKMMIGSVYQVGEAQVQVCQPRQPCFKLGIRFGTQSVLKKFLNSQYPGVYFRVVKHGHVKCGDEFDLISEHLGCPSISEVYSLIYHEQPSAQATIQAALACIYLPEGCKDLIRTTQS